MKESKRPKRRPLPNEDGKKKELLANPLSCTLQLQRQRRLQKGVHWKGKDIWIPVRLTFFRAREGESPPSGIANPPSLLQLPTTPDPPFSPPPDREGDQDPPSLARTKRNRPQEKNKSEICQGLPDSLQYSTGYIACRASYPPHSNFPRKKPFLPSFAAAGFFSPLPFFGTSFG